MRRLGNTIVLTRVLAFASGTDAGNRNMRKRWPRENDAWDADDYNAAVSKTNALLAHVPFENGGLLMNDGTVLNPDTGECTHQLPPARGPQEGR